MTQSSVGARVLNVTVNLVGTSHELREVKEDRLWGRYSYGKYPANAGIERMLDLFGRTGIKATFFVPAFEAAKAPDMVRAIAAAGHEIAAHGNAMEDHSQLGDAEAGLLAGAHETLSEIASVQDDDFPYSLETDGGGAMVELPQNEMLIDATLWNVRQTHERVLKTWIEEFEGLYNESCYACLTLHPRSDFGSGRASRIALVEAFLRHVRSLSDVAVTTCGTLASQFAIG
jgi:peptidoglycan/xylan/chitin deacetylase (PgdA/CDA1 family)